MIFAAFFAIAVRPLPLLSRHFREPLLPPLRRRHYAASVAATPRLRAAPRFAAAFEPFSLMPPGRHTADAISTIAAA